MAISNNSTGLRPGVCTSTTRPTNPYEGFMIYETDTDLVYLYNGSAWVEVVSALTKAPRGIMAFNKNTTTDTSITSEEVTITSSSFTAVANRYYRITYFEPDIANGTSTTQNKIRAGSISGTILNTTYQGISASSPDEDRTITVTWVGTLTAGTQVVVATIKSDAGTAGAGRGADYFAYLLVEDIGAA